MRVSAEYQPRWTPSKEAGSTDAVPTAVPTEASDLGTPLAESKEAGSGEAGSGDSREGGSGDKEAGSGVLSKEAGSGDSTEASDLGEIDSPGTCSLPEVGGETESAEIGTPLGGAGAEGGEKGDV